MKRILFFIFAAVLLFSTSAMAQKEEMRKVAVWETKCSDNSITQFQSTMVRGGMETAVGNTPGYEVFDRSAFDIILKEHHFERSGAVSDAEIREMGEMAGVQFVIVPEAVFDGSNSIYILVKMLDVEKGKFGGVHDALCSPSPTDIRKTCQDLGASLFGEVSGERNARRPFAGAVAQRGQDFTETAFGINMKMVYVEGGTFVMGCTDDQGGECDDDESPTRMTTVGSFYIGMLEVTQSQWEKVMGTSIYQQRDKANMEWPIKGAGPNYPMYYVSWEEANEFCARLSRATGKTYSLPTEAEWEYAARGGKNNEGTKYAGDWSIDDVAWYLGNSGKSTHICGTKRPNALGIFDMSGNVWEWCEDWYGSQYLQYDNNPKGAGAGSHRVLRGGGWDHNARICRVANRGYSIPSMRFSDYGFRVVLH